MKNRAQRRADASYLRHRAAEWPERLVEVPSSEWPARKPEQDEFPERLWRSRHFLVQQYACPSFGGIAVCRLSVNRALVDTNGQWKADISWDDLQAVKQQTGHGDWYGIEIFPRDRDLVNVANMRHLWLLSEPLPIGWFEAKET